MDLSDDAHALRRVAGHGQKRKAEGDAAYEAEMCMGGKRMRGPSVQQQDVRIFLIHYFDPLRSQRLPRQ